MCKSSKLTSNATVGAVQGYRDSSTGEAAIVQLDEGLGHSVQQNQSGGTYHSELISPNSTTHASTQSNRNDGSQLLGGL